LLFVSFSGAEASKKVSGAYIRSDTNWVPQFRKYTRHVWLHCKTSRSSRHFKVGESDPKRSSGNRLDHRIKGTPGITGSYFLRVPIDGNARHLDVGSSRPAAAGGRKGGTVRPRKRYVSWVQNVVRQFGFYLRWVIETAGKTRLYERIIWFSPLVHLLSFGRHSREAT